jgi:hypothetical protein
METLASAGNVLIPAVLALREGGFDVSRHNDENQEEWRAERGDLLLVADDPLALLGLAALREQRGADWHANDAEIESILSEYYGD